MDLIVTFYHFLQTIEIRMRPLLLYEKFSIFYHHFLTWMINSSDWISSNAEIRITKKQVTVNPDASWLYRVSQKKWPDFTISYLQKYWIWRFQIFYSYLAWVEIIYWKIWWDYLTRLKFCWCLKISKFWAL